MKNCFITVTEEFKRANNGTKEGVNNLLVATTNQGALVVSINAVSEFPSLFIDKQRLNIVWLGDEDFNTKTL